jgi:hypothetical protein
MDEIAQHAFSLGEQPASRVQRLSATRAARRVIRRLREMDEQRNELLSQARRRIRAVLGRETDTTQAEHDEYEALLKADWAARKADGLFEAAYRIGFKNRYRSEGGRYFYINTDYWHGTTIGKGRAARLWFHGPDVPVQVWAVKIDRSGIHWFDAEVIRVTERNVMVRHAGEQARLNRERLWQAWGWWRGVMFVSSRTGYIAGRLEEIWWERYGATGSLPPVMQMPLAEAIALLGIPTNYTREDVMAAFRRAVKKAHPDLGGTAEDFRKLVEARDRLLAAIGTSAPRPKMPAYYPSGTTIVYRSGGGSHRRLGQTRRLANVTALAGQQSDRRRSVSGVLSQGRNAIIGELEQTADGLGPSQDRRRTRAMARQARHGLDGNNIEAVFRG